MRRLVLLAGLGVAACSLLVRGSIDDYPDGDADADTDADTDADSDADADRPLCTESCQHEHDCGAFLIGVEECVVLCECASTVFRHDFFTATHECLLATECGVDDREELCGEEAAAATNCCSAEAIAANDACESDPECPNLECTSVAVYRNEYIEEWSACLERPRCVEKQSCMDNLYLAICPLAD